MTPIDPNILQAGFAGILLMVLGGLYKLAAAFLSRVATRIESSADKIEAALHRIIERQDAHELSDEQRHAVTLAELHRADRHQHHDA